MFNTYHAGNQNTNIQINAVTGAILKNHPKSWFEKFNLNGERAKQLLCEGGDAGFELRKSERGYSWYQSAPEKAIVVLQMVICGDMQVMAECVYKKDLEETTA